MPRGGAGAWLKGASAQAWADDFGLDTQSVCTGCGANMVLRLRDGGGGVVKIVVRGQSLQINLNQTSGQTRCMATASHDHSNGLADISHFMHGQHRKCGVLHEGQEGVDMGQVKDTQVSCGEDLQHSGHLKCVSRVDAFDRGMRLRAANKGHIFEMGQLDVVSELALAPQQGVVFPP